MHYQTNSREETFNLGKQFSSKISKGIVICLNGEMGAGKTIFTKGLLEGIGYDEEVTSPTFALCHRYETVIPVLHYDLYRLNNYDDLYSIGFFDDVNEDVCTIIEWSCNAKDFLPEKVININFYYGKNENQRIIQVEE